MLSLHNHAPFRLAVRRRDPAWVRKEYGTWSGQAAWDISLYLYNRTWYELMDEQGNYLIDSDEPVFDVTELAKLIRAHIGVVSHIRKFTAPGEYKHFEVLHFSKIVFNSANDLLNSNSDLLSVVRTPVALVMLAFKDVIEAIGEQADGEPKEVAD